MQMNAAELALSWLLNRDETIIPIPGTRSSVHLNTMAKAAYNKLDRKQMKEIETILQTNILEIVDIKNKKFKNYSKEIIKNEIINTQDDFIIQIIIADGIFKKELDIALGLIFDRKEKYLIEDDFFKLKNKNKTFLILKMENLKYETLNKIAKRLNFSKKSLNGIILLS